MVKISVPGYSHIAIAATVLSIAVGGCTTVGVSMVCGTASATNYPAAITYKDCVEGFKEAQHPKRLEPAQPAVCVQRPEGGMDCKPGAGRSEARPKAKAWLSRL